VVGFVVGFLDKGVNVHLGKHVSASAEDDKTDGPPNALLMNCLAAYPQQTAHLGDSVAVLGEQ
jgi:hypothetical protein